MWALVSVGGAGALGYAAAARGESVSALWLMVAALCTFAIAWRFHSAWLAAKVLALDDTRATPAVSRADGKDFVPTHRWVTFGHHFAAIAGPGPLVGPVLAAQFGYLPGTLWILIGATLGGAVQDAVILYASIRKGGRSLGEMIREEIGEWAGLVASVAILAIMVILIAVLALVVVNALAESPWGWFTILATIPIAMIMGLGMRSGKGGVGVWSAAGVALLLAAVWAGGHLPPALHEALNWKKEHLAFAVIGYGAAASALPVWLLLAPRDYLSSFLKIGAVAALAAAVLLLAPEMRMPALTRYIDGTGPVFAGPVFPFCFITIACGAVSGFHALISSGTTPKMLDRESAVRFVGYGAMITEMLVAVTALIAACTLEPGVYFAINMKGDPTAVIAQVNAAGFPVSAEQMRELADRMGEPSLFGKAGGAPTFAVGMAEMFSKAFGTGRATSALWYHFAIMFEALFILTTIDAGTRVGRFLVQDMLGRRWQRLGPQGGLASDWFASLLFVAAWGHFLYHGVVDPLGGINSLWPVFGIANQLLAVIALAFGSVLLMRSGRARYAWVTALPLAFLFAVTMTAGWQKIFSADERLGFLAQAKGFAAKLAAAPAGKTGELAARLANTHLNIAVTAAFLGLAIVIVGLCAARLVRAK